MAHIDPGNLGAWTRYDGAALVPFTGLLLLLGFRRRTWISSTLAILGAALAIAAGPLLTVHYTDLTLTPWDSGAFGLGAAQSPKDLTFWPWIAGYGARLHQAWSAGGAPGQAE